eukprot:CAMPEP_0113549804 /NCGR_PEP_ID=MMETSP0015_2-20120614/13637_1 /TAXON_ID=2838 /ORGANISM="Odontella" /LENGTH=358 /DNA_ID=CAMNT_0000450555 /DNA_START=113 /DNA_END=1188 /DNA_ORIENTATION=- /assembly_acc=CAM_ASM_000160
MRRSVTVTFNCAVVLHRTAALCDYTDEERSACFVSEEDYVEMREGAKRTVIQARRKAARAKYRKQEPTMPNHHDGSDDSDDNGGCLRGLEHLLDTSVLTKKRERSLDTSVLAKKRERRDTVRAAVLVSPHNGNGSAGVYSSVDVLAKASKKATFRASRDAAEVGAQDAAIAAKIHSKAMLHQDPMDMDIDTALLNARKSRRITPLCSAKVYAKSIRQDPMDIDTALLNARKFDAAADYIRSSSQSSEKLFDDKITEQLRQQQLSLRCAIARGNDCLISDNEIVHFELVNHLREEGQQCYMGSIGASDGAFPLSLYPKRMYHRAGYLFYCTASGRAFPGRGCRGIAPPAEVRGRKALNQ